MSKTEDGGKTATATITVEKAITDNQGPTIVSIKGEKDSEGNYKVIIKATDESGIGKVLINGAEITTKDSRGNFYFIPTENVMLLSCSRNHLRHCRKSGPSKIFTRF